MHTYIKYRSRADIASAILETANGGATKTKIMYGAYLSYAQLKEYLAAAIQNGLLEPVDDQHIYKTTAKGMHFMKAYEQIGSMITPVIAAASR